MDISRQTNYDAILPTGSAYTMGTTAPVVDLRYGGQMGYVPELGEILSHQSYVRRQMFCLLMAAPRGFGLLPNPDVMIGTLKSLVEKQALSIEGLAAGVEVTFDETPVGGAGELQEDYTNVTRARSEPVFRWKERYNMAISRFLEMWITSLMMDPDSKYANVVSFGQNAPTDFLNDWSAATMLFVEPDPTHTKVIQAWLTTNMMPKNTGERIGKRDKASASETVELSIPFTGISQYGIGVNQLAQRILDEINIVGANPMLRPAFIQEISPFVNSVGRGYKETVEDIAVNGVTL